MVSKIFCGMPYVLNFKPTDDASLVTGFGSCCICFGSMMADIICEVQVFQERC